MKFIAGLLTVLVLIGSFNPVLAQEEKQNASEDAKIDAQADVSPILWFVAGFGCGVCGIAAPYVLKPTVPVDRLIGKSPEYMVLYTQEYQRRVRREQAERAALGCVVGTLVSLAYSIAFSSRE